MTAYSEESCSSCGGSGVLEVPSFVRAGATVGIGCRPCDGTGEAGADGWFAGCGPVVSPFDEEDDTTSVSYRQRPDVVAAAATARLRGLVESGGAR